MKAVLIIGVTVLLAGLLWALRSHRERPAAPDAQVLAQLAKAGSDLSKPHDIEFFLYFPTEAAAKAAAAEIEGAGFHAVIDRAANRQAWLLQLTRSMRPVEAELVRLRGEFEALAAKHAGMYDGWGSPVVPGA